jgi:hypothetical protein
VPMSFPESGVGLFDDGGVVAGGTFPGKLLSPSKSKATSPNCMVFVSNKRYKLFPRDGAIVIGSPGFLSAYSCLAEKNIYHKWTVHLFDYLIILSFFWIRLNHYSIVFLNVNSLIIIIFFYFILNLYYLNKFI